MTRFSTFLRGFVLTTILAGTLPAVAQAQPANSLIKGSGPAVYFYAVDGKRYVFPNEQTYRSWYSSQMYIVPMSDSDIGFIPIGGNVTIKPGSTLVKVTTDPKVYLVARGRVLRWVQTEQLAQALYGATWNKKVVDVPDVFFTNYLVGDPIMNADDVTLADFVSLTLPDLELFGPGSQTVTFPTVAAAPASPAVASPSVIITKPTFTMNIIPEQASFNQPVQIFAQITGNPKPILKLEIYSESGGALLATCPNSTTCSAAFTVTTAPLIEKFYPIAYDADGRILMPAELRPTLVVPSTSNEIQMSVSPQTIANGSRANFTSEYNVLGYTASSHKIYARIPGNPQPYLWKDCGGTNSCAGSSVFYRTTDLFSKVTVGGDSIVSPIVRLSTSGGEAPKPVLVATPLTSNTVKFDMTPPSGEMIGQTFIVDGTTAIDPPYAMCDGPCSITLQINKAGDVTAFTWVGGKQEASNTISVSPQ